MIRKAKNVNTFLEIICNFHFLFNIAVSGVCWIKRSCRKNGVRKKFVAKLCIDCIDVYLVVDI